MERLDGIAENVRHTIHVSAGGSRTDHLALFEISGRRLSFRGQTPVAIKEGDDLVVVWEPGDKGFDTVLAFHNRTAGARDHDVRRLGCGGCGCSTVVVIPLCVISVWAAIQRGEWFHAAVSLAAAVLLFFVHLLGRKADRDTAEKLRQVNALLDEDDK